MDLVVGLVQVQDHGNLKVYIHHNVNSVYGLTLIELT